MKPSNSGNKGSRPWCEVLRQRGNEVYIKVSRGNLGPSLTRYNLQKAHELYEKALRVSRTSDKEASCYKNLGALNWVWAKSEWAIYQQELTAQKGNGGEAATKFRMAKCVEFYFKALHYGSLAMKQGQWITQIEDTLSKIVEWSYDHLYTHLSNFEPVMRVLCETVACSEAEWPGRRRMAVLLYKIHADFILGRGIQYLMSTELSGGSSEREGYKKCLNATRDCYRPLERAESILHAGPPMGYQELVNQVRDLKKEVLNYQTLCEAIQSRIQGEELLGKAMHGDMEIIWEAIDYFKHSLRVTQEKQLENEAIALSRIGKSYSCVLKMEKQAHSYHLQSIRIALTIMSGRIANADWYIFSSQAVRKHGMELSPIVPTCLNFEDISTLSFQKDTSAMAKDLHSNFRALRKLPQTSGAI